MKHVIQSPKKYFKELYKRSKIFRNIANFFGLSFGTTVIVLLVGGTCPCCGSAACPVGFTAAGVTGTFATGIVFLLSGIRKTWKIVFA